MNLLKMATQTNEELMKIVINCVNFAAIKHKNQRRMDSASTPYINHPIGNQLF